MVWRALVPVCLAVVVALPATGSSTTGRVAAGYGLSVVLPHGWRLAHTRVTPCSSPAQVLLAVRGRLRLRPALRVPPRAALVLLLETSSGRFPRRPRHFTIPTLGPLGGCCEIPRGPGAELLFRDRGRKFYAFVYVGKGLGPAAGRQVERLLDSLRVAPSR